MERLVCIQLILNMWIDWEIAGAQYNSQKKPCVQTMLRVCNSISEVREGKYCNNGHG